MLTARKQYVQLYYKLTNLNKNLIIKLLFN